RGLCGGGAADAFRRPGGDHARALAADPGPEPPGEDVVATRKPEVERRHRLGRVLADQRRQRLDVVALEGIHVALEQRALLVVELARGGGRADTAPGQAGA